MGAWLESAPLFVQVFAGLLALIAAAGVTAGLGLSAYVALITVITPVKMAWYWRTLALVFLLTLAAGVLTMLMQASCATSPGSRASSYCASTARTPRS